MVFKQLISCLIYNIASGCNFNNVVLSDLGEVCEILHNVHCIGASDAFTLQFEIWFAASCSIIGKRASAVVQRGSMNLTGPKGAEKTQIGQPDGVLGRIPCPNVKRPQSEPPGNLSHVLLYDEKRQQTVLYTNFPYKVANTWLAQRETAVNVLFHAFRTSNSCSYKLALLNSKPRILSLSKALKHVLQVWFQQFNGMASSCRNN